MAVVGTTVLTIGAILIVTPGPALIVIPIGLAILALEFEWARRLLKRVRGEAVKRLGGEEKFERRMQKQRRFASMQRRDGRWVVRQWSHLKLKAIHLLQHQSRPTGPDVPPPADDDPDDSDRERPDPGARSCTSSQM